MSILQIDNLIHEYKEYDGNDEEVAVVRALDDITLAIDEGDFVALLGHNGSGKSTLAKHMNALLLPTSGTVLFLGRDTAKTEPVWQIRRDAGMIFQNPDNQIIGTSVEEDVAFGPENIGVEKTEMEARLEQALSAVGMTAYRFESPNRLSGGQKQRVAIAGMLAMKPKCILLDEPTAMLDPIGRAEVLNTIHELNQKEKITVVLITHHMEEAVRADKVVVMDNGRVILTGTPKEVFSHVEELKHHHLSVPAVTELAWQLKKDGFALPDGILTMEELSEALWNLR